MNFLGSKDCQLVTWSRDQTLRIWRVDPHLQKVSAVGKICPMCRDVDWSSVTRADTNDLFGHFCSSEIVELCVTYKDRQIHYPNSPISAIIQSRGDVPGRQHHTSHVYNLIQGKREEFHFLLEVSMYDQLRSLYHSMVEYWNLIGYKVGIIFYNNTGSSNCNMNDKLTLIHLF